MQSGDGRAQKMRGQHMMMRRLRFGVLSAAAIVCLFSAGCATTGQPVASRNGPTVAFDVIDGPPPAVFTALVDQLGEKASARQVAVVSRAQPAQYRVRGYLAASSDAQQTTIAWVLDVYGADGRRALRLSGEEKTARSGADAWAAADSATLSRIAETGMTRLASFLETGRAASPAIASAQPQAAPVQTVSSQPASPQVAERSIFGVRDDFLPEAAGIFRLLKPAPAVVAQDESADDAPSSASGRRVAEASAAR